MDCDFVRCPAGKCLGWHKLSEKEYTEALKKYEAKEPSYFFALQLIIQAW